MYGIYTEQYIIEKIVFFWSIISKYLKKLLSIFIKNKDIKRIYMFFIWRKQWQYLILPFLTNSRVLQYFLGEKKF